MSLIPDELWKPIEKLEGFYEVSNQARIRSIPHPSRRMRVGTIMKPCINSTGYLIVRYRRPYERAVKAMIIHREVAKAFIPNLKQLSDVNHKNGDKQDNRLENLEWSSHLENVRHAFRTGLVASGEARKHSKLTDKAVREIRKKYVPRLYSQYKLANEYGVSQSTVRFALMGKTWKGTV